MRAANRVIDHIVKEFYDTALGKAQEEAFRNAISLDKHPTLTRTVLGKCCTWCDEMEGVYVYPKGKCFARHDNCDCLIVASGYNSRNGIVRNYVKHKNTPERQTHIEPTLEKLRNDPNETTIAFSYVLEGQKKEANLGKISRDAADVLGVKRKTEIKITRSSALHMDNSGHFSGIGFTTNGHNDTNPLSVKDITNISEIVKNANKNNTVLGKPKYGNQRFQILGNADNRQVVIIERTKQGGLNIVTSYKVSRSRYERYLKEIRQ